MYVRNRVGYNFAFKYRDTIITIPYDGIIYSIPNDCPTFKELQIIMPMHIRTQKVIYIKVDGSISDKVNGPKRSGRPPRKDKYDSKGKRYARRGNIKRKVEEPKLEEPVIESQEDNSSVVDIDLDVLINSIDTSASVKESKEDKPKTTKKKSSTTKKATPKKKKSATKKTTTKKKKSSTTKKKTKTKKED